MDAIVLGLFLVAAFLGGFAAGLAGFAMGFVVSGIWLHILTPVQTTTLIVGYGVVTQGYGVWKLRHALTWETIAPFIIGGTIGVPIGTMLLTYVDPAYLRGGVGLLLVSMAPMVLPSRCSSRRRTTCLPMLVLASSMACLLGLPDCPGSSLPSGASCAAGRRTCSALYSNPSCWQQSSSTSYR
jgi:uncharacterized membrane protein YfcA